MVHLPAVKGSAMAPKSRFVVAVEMYRDQVMFWSPYTKRTFRSKSYVAYTLRAGLNYMHVLGLPIQQGTLGQNTLPANFNEQITIKLPQMTHGQDCERLQLQPTLITSVKVTDGNNIMNNKETALAREKQIAAEIPEQHETHEQAVTSNTQL